MAMDRFKLAEELNALSAFGWAIDLVPTTPLTDGPPCLKRCMGLYKLDGLGDHMTWPRLNSA